MQRLIGLFNLSTVLSEDHFKAIGHACQQQIADDVAPAYGMLSVGVIAYPKDAPVPDFVERIVIFDDSEQAGVLGWHSCAPDGRPFGRAFAKTVLANGGGILAPLVADVPYCIASDVSHEVVEQYVDPRVNVWCDGPNGSMAFEACDAVEAGFYYKQVGDVRVAVSDFVLPAFFCALDAKGPYDQLGYLKAPFTLADGGYCIQRSIPDDEGQVFGASLQLADCTPPTWRLEAKRHPAARSARRGA